QGTVAATRAKRCKMTRCAGTLIAALIVTAPAFGEDLSYTPPAAPAAPATSYLLLRLAGMTLVPLAACGAIVWLNRSIRPRNVRPADGSEPRLAHVQDIPLDRRSSLHLVKVCGRRVVLGTDAAGLKAMVLLPESFAGALADEQPDDYSSAATG